MANAAQRRAFIEAIAPIIVKRAREAGYKVASPIIAQAILESGWGESSLAAKYHNYFGMKCGSSWTGASVNMATKEEYTPGTLTNIKANFRAYASMEEGVAGYFDFISMKRYSNLKTAASAYAYLQLIKEDGYATSTGYVTNCMTVVRENELEKFDDELIHITHKEEVQIVENRRQKVVAQAKGWLGKNEADGSHRAIIDIYNSHTPLARGYKVKYTDSWCAAFVSAVAIATDCTDIIPLECGCGQMIALFIALGRWMEDDSYVPQPGDVIFYDWDDTGKGDNTGWPDHVGYVESCDGKNIIVIEGNYSDAVKPRTIAVNGKNIRGFGLPDYGTDAPASTGKTNEQIAQEVIGGKWGTGEDRKAKLTAAGYNYTTIQQLVNQMLKAESKPEAPAAPSYSVGGVYTITASALSVRVGAGTGYKKKTHNQLTKDGQKHDANKNGCLDKGTKVTCQEVKKIGSDVWIRVPSGWMAAYYKGEVYLQ